MRTPDRIPDRIASVHSLRGLTVGAMLRSVKLRWALLLLLLAGYCLLLVASGPLDPDLNLADRIDATILGRHAYVYDPRTRLAQDPEGLLSTVPAVASVLIGIQAGAWVPSAVYAAAFAAAVWLLIACLDARGLKITI